MNNAKELHTACKEIVSQYGEAVVGTPQFKNLLADYGAFKDIPATKQILTDLQRSGFGSFLYELKQKQDKDILTKCFDHRKEFLSEGKYREDVTVYVYASMLYALGLIADVSEPKVKNPFTADKGSLEKAVEKKPIPRVDLGKMTEQLKNDYLTLLKEVVLPDPTNEGQASGFYTTITRTKLLVVEEKLRIVGERVNRDYLSWCKQQKEQALSHFFKDEKGQQCKLLKALRQKYLNTFDAYHKPKGKQLHGSFDNATISLQKKIETDIRYLSSCLDEDADWCQKEQQKFLSERSAAEKKRKGFLTALCTTAAAIIIGIITTVSIYANSADDRALFEKNYATAQAAYDKGDYTEALELYRKTEDNYSALWERSGYKTQAHNGAIAASKKIFASGNPAIQQAVKSADYIGAYLAIKSLPTNLVLGTNEQNRLDSTTKFVESKLDGAIKSELYDLINEIYASKGHLSVSAQQRIDRLLKVDSDSYWLNFLKNKAQ